MSIPKLRPLNKVTEMVRAAGFEITYAYDDLVFIEHSEIIIQFEDSNIDDLKLFIHQDIKAEDKEEIIKKLSEKAGTLNLVPSGSFSLKEKTGENEVELTFYQ